jgi:ribosome-associated translation inhibitor RaiA
MTRIHVASDNAIGSQARTYAEYRVFAALTRHAQQFERARVLLRPVHDDGTRAAATCSVSVTLDRSRALRVRATGPHVYAAINRAIDRLDGVLDQRVGERRSS